MDFLVYLLAGALVGIGFITNAVPWTSFNFGTLVVDILYVLIGLAVVRRLPQISRERLRALRFPLIVFGLFAVWCAYLLVSGENDFRDRVMGFRNNVVYPAIWVALALVPCRLSRKRILDLVWYLGLATCVLGIGQSFFHQHMPELLLTLHGTDKHFGFYGTDIFRVTGLVGNPLVFSGFCSFMVLIGWFRRGYECHRFERYLIWLPVVAMYLTYTRTSNVALLLVWGFAWAVLARAIPFWRRALRVLVVAGVLGFLLFAGKMFTDLGEAYPWVRNSAVGGEVTFVVGRMSGTELTTQESDEVHFRYWREGFAALSGRPVRGLGLGSQGYSVKDVSTTYAGDGSYFALLLETGCVGFVLAFVVVICQVWMIFRRFCAATPHSRDWNFYALMFLTAGYFAMASVLNSSFTSRTNMCLFFILLGVMLSEGGETETTA